MRAGGPSAASPGTKPVGSGARDAAEELTMASSTPPASLADFIGLCGLPAWNERLSQLRASGTSREGKSAQQFHAIEVVLDRLSRGRSNRPLTVPEQRIATIATDAVICGEPGNRAGRGLPPTK